MSKKYMYLFGAALLALTGIGATAQSAQAKTAHHYRTNVTRNVNANSYFVNAPQSIGSNARVIKGTASKGFRVTLQNGKKVLASTYANKKTGRYTLRIPKGLKADMHLTVTAQKGYWHPYRVIFVKTPANQKAAVQANKKVNKKVAKKTVKKPVKKSVKKTVKKTPKVTTKSSVNATVAQLKNQMNDLKIRNAKERVLYNRDEADLAKIEADTSSKVAAKRANLKAIIANAEQALAELDDETGNVKTTNKNAKQRIRKSAKKVNKKANKVNRNRKTTRKSNKANKVTVKTPNGNWKSYNQRWNLSQKRGLNEQAYKNGRYGKKYISNAPYKVNSVKNNVWTISYQNRNKNQSMTLQFLTNNNFKLTSQNGHKTNVSFVRY
ncbi:hypothetical protein ACPOK3_05745 [Acetilactobacillus jinshanensis]|uniref:hypothetical protein n=1 Tax=Acetilactobacillus jinshanensis TaxID=1720083 RepID=UPI003CE568DE